MSLNSGSCWDILKLETTEDKKLIKRAYHKLLRQYKPDEHPQEFKILYQAYQDALDWEEPYDWESEGTDEDFDWDIYWEDEEKEKENQTSNPQKAEELQIIDDSEQQWNYFQKEVDELTKNNNYPERFNQLERWEFLEEISSDVLLDGYASQYLFDAVTEFEKRFDNLLLSQELILYMDNIFLWSKYWQKYDEYSPIFEYLTTQNAVNLYEKLEQRHHPLASFQQRAKAFITDFLLLVFAVLVVLLFGEEDVPELTSLLAIYFVYVAFVFWFLAIRTPAYYFFKLQVLEGDFCDSPTKTARGIRVILTLISASSLYLTLTLFNQVPFAILIVIANIFLIVKKKKLIQDISGTRVYDISQEY